MSCNKFEMSEWYRSRRTKHQNINTSYRFWFPQPHIYAVRNSITYLMQQWCLCSDFKGFVGWWPLYKAAPAQPSSHTKAWTDLHSCGERSCLLCCVCWKPEGEILVLFRQECLFVTMMVQLWSCGGVSGALRRRSASCEIHNQLVCQQVCVNCHCGYFQAA